MIGLEEALAALPHGPGFRFVDRLLELDPGKTGVGEFTLHGNEPFLAGHFPGDPLLPGVLLLEAVAQLAGVVAQSDPERAPLRNLRLGALRAAKITGSIRPGQTVQLHAEIAGRLGGLIQARGRAQIQGRVVLATELVLSGSLDDVDAGFEPPQ